MTSREGYIVTGKIDVSGGSGNDVNFYVTDPDGNTILRYDKASHTSFSFTATKPGTYTLFISINSFSIISSKSVILEYSVKTLIFGIPEDIFYLILAIILIALIIIVIATVLKRHRPQKQ